MTSLIAIGALTILGGGVLGAAFWFAKYLGREEIKAELSQKAVENAKITGEIMATPVTRDDTIEQLRDGNF